MRAFLGLVRYYQQYIPGFAGVAQPLNRLTAKEEEQQAFDHLKQRLMEAPILAYPDPAKEYILDTDASDHSVGAVLSQVQGGTEVVVAYYSKTLTAAEKNYCIARKELLAVAPVVPGRRLNDQLP